MLGAEAFVADRTDRARGRAARFADAADAYGEAPAVTRLRLRMQTVEEALGGRRKLIVDRAADGARRLIYLGRKGLWAPPAAPPEPPSNEIPPEPGEPE